jgi:hypothetical protein
MGEMFFVLLTVIALKPAPAADGRPEVRAGDVISSSLVGAAVSYENCMEGGEFLADPIRKAGGDATTVVVSCPLLPADIGMAQGFTETEDLPAEGSK